MKPVFCSAYLIIPVSLDISEKKIGCHQPRPLVTVVFVPWSWSRDASRPALTRLGGFGLGMGVMIFEPCRDIVLIKLYVRDHNAY